MLECGLEQHGEKEPVKQKKLCHVCLFDHQIVVVVLIWMIYLILRVGVDSSKSMFDFLVISCKLFKNRLSSRKQVTW